MKSSKFYSKSLTLLLQLLQMINAGKISSEIAESLDMHKSHVSYYVHKTRELGLIKEPVRGAFKILELTQPGKNFLAMYTNPDLHDTRVCRAENIRFKAEIISMPSIPVDWHKVALITATILPLNLFHSRWMEKTPTLYMTFYYKIVCW